MGPFAGYFAQRYPGQLTIAPVAPDPGLPALTFTYAMALGVRKGDAALRDTLQDTPDRRHIEIDAILRQYGVPLVTTTPAPDVPGS